MAAVAYRIRPFRYSSSPGHTAFETAKHCELLSSVCFRAWNCDYAPAFYKDSSRSLKAHISLLSTADSVRQHRAGSFLVFDRRNYPLCRSPPASEIETLQSKFQKNRRTAYMAEKDRYIVRVQGNLVEVSEEVYRAYYGIERHLLTLNEKDERNGKTLYSDLDTAETLREEMIPDLDALSVEDAAIAHILCNQLHHALKLLPLEEKKLIDAIYFEGLSERQLSERIGVHYMTLHNRKVRILKKLNQMLNSRNI